MAEAGVQIRKAISDDIASIVELNFALFQEDAGQRDPYMNLNWPKEEGHEHFSKLVSGDDSVCLLSSAYSPDLPGCVATGRTRAQVTRNMREAIELHVRGLLEDKLPIPKAHAFAEYVAVR